jgi:cation diffusion facilitator family transporter
MPAPARHLDPWTHRHDFQPDHSQAERGTRWVMGLTAVTMLVEIVAGTLAGSMALLADGWHMATHVAAFGIALFAYRFARTHADNPLFAFGTGKVTVLGGFTSAIALAMVALVMVFESLSRLLSPRPIRFDEAIYVAILGLVVNLVSGVILHRSGHGHEHGAAHDDDHADSHAHDRDHADDNAHDHPHDHDHGHDHDHHDDHGDHGDHGDHDHHRAHPASHEDHNLRAAYLHVVADAMTSVLAIIALYGGKYFGLNWLDAAMGIVGAVLISRWAWGLALQSGAVLLDRSSNDRAQGEILRIIGAEPDHEVSDLHVWQVGPGALAATLSIVTHRPHEPQYYRTRLAGVPGLVHTIIEVNQCRDAACQD